MTTRTLLLTLHIASVTGWLGADILQYVISPRLERGERTVAIAWARVQLMLHEKYYAVVVVVVLATGVLLVLDGDWPWSSGFIWVGVGAIVGGATLGGQGLRNLTKKRVVALEAGDDAAVAQASRRAFPLSVIVTALPLVAILAMVDKWHAG